MFLHGHFLSCVSAVLVSILARRTAPVRALGAEARKRRALRASSTLAASSSPSPGTLASLSCALRSPRKMPTLLFQGHCILDGVVVVVAIGVVVVVVVGCFGAGPRRFRARLVSWGKPHTYPTAGAEAESVLGAPRASPEALGPSGRASWESGWLRHAMHVQTGLPEAPPHRRGRHPWADWRPQAEPRGQLLAQGVLGDLRRRGELRR